MPLYLSEEVIERLGLTHETVRSSGASFLPKLSSAIQAREDDDRYMRVVPFEETQQIEAIFAGQLDIQDGQTEGDLACQFRRFRCGNGGGDLHALFAKVEREHLPERRLIVNKQDVRIHRPPCWYIASKKQARSVRRPEPNPGKCAGPGLQLEVQTTTTSLSVARLWFALRRKGKPSYAS